MSSSSRLAAMLAIVLGTAGCGAFDPPPPPVPFKVAVVVHGDPGVPLAGVAVKIGPETNVTTDAYGRAEISFAGAEGEERQVSVTCPAGHQQPPGVLSIRLTRLATDKIPEYEVACPPLRRRVVVAVRAENGPYLPVKYLNQVVATTDETGAAHFALDVEPGSFSVMIDTTERKDLKPPSPAKVLTVGNSDDILVFDQPFVLPKKKRIIRKVHIAKRLGG